MSFPWHSHKLASQVTWPDGSLEQTADFWKRREEEDGGLDLSQALVKPLGQPQANQNDQELDLTQALEEALEEVLEEAWHLSPQRNMPYSINAQAAVAAAAMPEAVREVPEA